LAESGRSHRNHRENRSSCHKDFCAHRYACRALSR
jgi:hypothetical protein